MNLRDDVAPTYALDEFARRHREVNRIVVLSRAFRHYFEFIDQERLIDERRDLALGLIGIGLSLQDAQPGWLDRPTVETMVTTSVDYFLGYPVNVLGDLYWSRPELMPATRSNVLAGLSGPAWKSAAEQAVQAEVEHMAWFKLPDIEKRLVDLLGSDWTCEPELRKQAVEAIEYRHVIVHHGCRISSKYLRQTGRTDLVPGKFLRYTFDEGRELVDPLLTLARWIDQLLVDKFTLAPFWPRHGKVIGTQKSDEHVREVIERLKEKERRRKEGEGKSPRQEGG